MYSVAVAVQYPHFVILCPPVSKARAITLEREIQRAVKAHPETYEKYAAVVRDQGYRGSVGGSAAHDNYFVYMAWK